MTEGQFAEFFLRQGQRVIETKTCFWYSHRPFLFMSLPYYRAVSPSRSELARLLLGGLAAGLRFPTDLDKSTKQIGILVCTDRGYDLSSLHSKSRTATRRGLENCHVEPLDFAYLAKHAQRLNEETFQRQGRSLHAMTEAQWRRFCKAASEMPDFEVWGAWVKGQLASFSVLAFVEGWIFFQWGSSATEYLPYNPNNALTFIVTKSKLSDPRVACVCYGAESPFTVSLDEYKLRMGYQRKVFGERIVVNPLMQPVLSLGGRRIIDWVARTHPESKTWRRASLFLPQNAPRILNHLLALAGREEAALERSAMNEELEHTNCAVCGKSDTAVFIQGPGPVQIVKCRHDGMVYMNPRPTTGAVRKFHTTFVQKDNLEMFNGYRREILSREAEAIKRLKPGGNLLDIGCGTGVFFDSFAKGNWHPYGLDIASLGVDIARAEQGAEVFNGTVAEAQYPRGFFDVVSILDTLYYDPDPKATLIEIRRILKDDGLLAAEVPGFTYTLLRNRGPLCWLLDRKWTKGYVGSFHLYYFSRRSLRLLLEASGFRVLKTIPEQASLGRGGLLRSLNDLHFALARLIFSASGGRLSVAGKELYLAVKSGPAAPGQALGSSA